MTANPILEELYRIRDEYAASFDYDFDALFDDVCRRQEQSRSELKAFPPRRPKSWTEPVTHPIEEPRP